MKFALGCPVSNRGWILPSWFSHAENACSVAGVEPYYVFVAGTSSDNTHDILDRHALKGNCSIIYTEEDERSGDSRIWNASRYKRMVKVRNLLLQEVRRIDPDAFLSVDSDILLNHESIVALMKFVETDYWAIGGKVYLTPPPQTTAPNYAHLRNGSMKRPDSEWTFQVDALMALKLMKRKAYNVDYSWSSLGEDLGWSEGVRNAGGSLLWDGSVASKHVMEKHLLGIPDPRLGW